MPADGLIETRQGNGAGNDRNPARDRHTNTEETGHGWAGVGCRRSSAANKNRVPRTIPEEGGPYLCIEIQPNRNSISIARISWNTRHPTWPLHDIVVSQYCMVYIVKRGVGRGETIHCAIVCAMKGGSGCPTKGAVCKGLYWYEHIRLEIKQSLVKANVQHILCAMGEEPTC